MRETYRLSRQIVVKVQIIYDLKKHCTDISYDAFMQKCMQKKPSLNNRYARVLSPYKCEQILLERRTLFPLD